MRVKIDIDTRTFVRFGLVVLAFVVGLAVLYHLQGPLTLIAVSLFLALALNPPVNWIARHLPGSKTNRFAGTAVAYMLVITILAGLLVVVIPPVAQQSSKFAQTVPSLVDQVLSKRDVLNDFLSQYGLQDQLDSAIESAKSQAASFAASVGSTLVNGVGATLAGIVNILFVLVLTFLMLLEGPGWIKRMWDLYENPERLERHRALVQRMYRIVTGYVNGQLIVASIGAVSVLVVVLILSALFPLPANLAIPLAVIAFIGALIPLVGTTIAAVVISLILVLNSLPATIVFVIFFIIYQQIENNLISPVVQSRAVELSALTVLVSILIGISLFGLLGGLLAIPVAGCIRVFINDRIEKSRKERAEENIKNPIKKLVSKLKAAKEA